MALFKRRKNDHPTRSQTGTSYDAKGQSGIKPADFKEGGSSRGVHLIDPVPLLASDYTASVQFAKMLRSDASVRTSLRAGKAPVLGGDYFIDSASNDPLDLQIAEFVGYNLFCGMTTPFLRTMEQILKFFETPRGNSIFELVWENREWAPTNSVQGGANRKNYTMLRKMAYRPSETISEYLYDNNGGPAGITHRAIQADGTQKEVKIDISKLAIFVFDSEGGDAFRGTSLLRSAYRNWYYKDKFYAIDGVQKERHGVGVPDIELQAGYDAEDKAAAIEMAKNLRTNQNAYIVRNQKMKVSFAELPGNLVNALESAEHHDIMIMKNIMVQFLNTAASGGRATSATAQDTFLKSMEYIANSICDVYNMYVIPPLVAYNFKTNRFPELHCKGIGQAKDLAMFAAAMNNLHKAGALEFDDATKIWIRETIDAPKTLPVKDATTADQAPTDTPPVEPTTNGKTKVPTNGNGKGKVPQGFNLGKGPGEG